MKGLRAALLHHTIELARRSESSAALAFEKFMGEVIEKREKLAESPIPEDLRTQVAVAEEILELASDEVEALLVWTTTLLVNQRLAGPWCFTCAAPAVPAAEHDHPEPRDP